MYTIINNLIDNFCPTGDYLWCLQCDTKQTRGVDCGRCRNDFHSFHTLTCLTEPIKSTTKERVSKSTTKERVSKYPVIVFRFWTLNRYNATAMLVNTSDQARLQHFYQLKPWAFVIDSLAYLDTFPSVVVQLLLQKECRATFLTQQLKQIRYPGWCV